MLCIGACDPDTPPEPDQPSSVETTTASQAERRIWVVDGDPSYLVQTGFGQFDSALRGPLVIEDGCLALDVEGRGTHPVILPEEAKYDAAEGVVVMDDQELHIEDDGERLLAATLRSVDDIAAELPPECQSDRYVFIWTLDLIEAQ